MKKQLLGALLALCLTLTLLPFGAAASKFADVPEGAYFAEPVAWAVENGITMGTSGTTFSPDITCTRAQVVTFLWRAANGPEPKLSVSPFSDVKADSYFCKAVLWALENQITSGTSQSTFSPDDNCTRAQVVTFLYRLKGAPSVTAGNTFSDVAKDAYYAAPVAWALENQITSGTSKTTFSPNLSCTRAQIVTFLYRESQLAEMFLPSKVAITAADGTVTTEEYQYDANGNNTRFSHNKGIVQTRTYDASGLPIEQVWSAGDDELTTRYEFDSNGNLIRKTDTWNWSSSPSVTTYQYDEQQRQISSHKENIDESVDTSYAYNEAGYLVSVFEHVTHVESGYVETYTNTYEYDEHGNVTKNVTIWDAGEADRESSMVDEYVYTYDAAGEIVAFDEVLDGETVITTTRTYSLAANGKLQEETLRETHADGKTRTYINRYDADGNISVETILGPDGKTELTREYEYLTIRVNLLPPLWQGLMDREIYA